MPIVGALPFTLTNGTTADASQVMADFNAIVSDVNTNAFSLTNVATFTGGVSTGSANAQIVATVAPTGFTLSAGKAVIFIAGYSNSGATTLNVQSSGATAVRKPSSGGPVALSGGEIFVGNAYQAIYDGTYWQLVGGSNVSLSATNVFTVPQAIVSTNATPLFLEMDDNGAGIGPDVVLYRHSTSPAANDAIGGVVAQGNNSAAAIVSYGYDGTIIADTTAGSEDATRIIQAMVGGALTTVAIFPQPAFSAHKNGSDQVVTSLDAVTFGTELYDIGSYFAAGAWTPPPGPISISAAVYLTATTITQATLLVYKNGSAFKDSHFGTGTGGLSAGTTINIQDQANGTDAYSIHISFVGTGTTTVAGDSALSWFMGKWG